MMRLVVGLGNPGRKHERNRHNIGFMAVERIAADCHFGNWRGRFQGLVAEGKLAGSPAILLKPQTYMNNSGQSVGDAMRYFRLTPADIIVLHDELDLVPGKVRVKVGGGHAGHNGLRSIHQHIGPDFVRVRLGIGHPGERHLVHHYVLGDFRKLDNEWLADLFAAIGSCAPALVENGQNGFQNCLGRQNRTVPASRPGRDKTAGESTSLPQPEPAAGVFQSLLKRLKDRMSP